MIFLIEILISLMLEKHQGKWMCFLIQWSLLLQTPSLKLQLLQVKMMYFWQLKLLNFRARKQAFLCRGFILLLTPANLFSGST